MSGQPSGAEQPRGGFWGTLLTRAGDGLTDDAGLAGRRDALAKQLAAAQVAQAERESRLANERHDAGLGREDAAVRAAELQPQVEAGAAEVRQLAADVATITGQIAARELERQAQAARERPRALAHIAVEYHDSAALVQQRAQAFAEAVRAHIARGRKLNAALPAPIKALGAGAIDERMRHTVRKWFEVPVSINPNVPPDMRPSLYVALIPASTINERSPLCKMDFVASEQSLLDDHVHLFERRRDAEAARKRRDAAGGSWHVRPGPDGLFELVQGELRGVAKDSTGTEEGAP